MRLSSTNSLRSYLVAVAGVVLATATRIAVDPMAGDRFPFLPFFVAIVLAAWYGGSGPAILAVGLSWLAIDRFQLEPSGPVPAFGARWQWAFAFLFLVGMAVALLGESLRAARHRARVSDAETRRVLEEQRADRERLRTTLASIADAVIATDPEGRVTALNPAAERLTGWAAAEATGHPLGEVFHLAEGEADAWADLLLTDFIRKDEALPPDDRKVLVARDRVARWIEQTTAPIMDERGAIGGTVIVFRDITERIRAESALRESERRFARFMQHLPGLAWIKDARGRYVYANDAAEAAFRTSRAGLHGKTDEEVFPPETAAQFREHDRRALEGGSGVQVVETLEHEDGMVHHSLVSKFPIPDADGLSAWIGGMAIDITDRLLAESSLRESEERFRHLAGAMPQIVWISRPDHSVEFYNDRWFEYTGLTPEQSYGPEGWRAAVHPDDIARVVEAGAASREASTPFDAEYRLRDRHGVYRWHLGRAVSVVDAEGGVVRRLGTATDIDDRKRAEQDARFLAEAGAALASLTDEAGALEQVARLAVPRFADWCAVDLLGDGGSLRRLAVAHTEQADAEPGKDPHRRHPTRPGTARGVDRVVRTGEPALVPEITDATLAAGAEDVEHLRLLRELGMRSYLCVPLVGRDGPLGEIAFIAAESGRRYGPDDLRLAEDLARRASIAIENARLYASLREADRRKEEFLAVLSHELRNPLAPIQTSLCLMGRAGRSGAEFERERAVVERQVRHLTRLVDDLLDVSRISRGRIELQTRVVVLSEVIAAAVEAVRSRIEERRQELDISLPEGPIRLEADPTRLEQVLLNLLTNAVKYTDTGGRISLSAGRDGVEVVVRVRDTGIGISPEMLPRVFDLFVQGERRLDQSWGGMGIGLSLVKDLVERHGGAITAHSEGPGRGSEFVVRLPVLSEAQADATDSPQVARPGASEVLPRRRILIVDDNTVAADSLGRLLDLVLGQEVRVAYDGRAALVTAETFRPEVVLLDLGMAAMDGYEVAMRLRERPGCAGMRIIAVTGWGQEEDRRRTRETGFDLHLVKPVDMNSLRKLLADPDPELARNGPAESSLNSTRDSRRDALSRSV